MKKKKKRMHSQYQYNKLLVMTKKLTNKLALNTMLWISVYNEILDITKILSCLTVLTEYTHM